jgi:hypothetical protein
MAMRGTLSNVFEIGGKTVAALTDYVGDATKGDILQIGDRQWTITHTSVMGGSAVAKDVAAGKPPMIGAEIGGVSKSDLLPYIGQTFEANTPT